MKKVTAIFIAFALLLSFGSCAKTAQQDLSTAEQGEVTAEPFESMDISYDQFSMMKTYDNLEELKDDSTLIVIASPAKTFTDVTPAYFDKNNNPVDSYEQASKPYCYTERDFKVYKVLKGDKSLKEVRVAENFVKTSSGSDSKIVGIEGDYIAKKNAKYMLFLMPSNYKGNHYFTCYNVGKINIDGKDPNCEQIVDNKMLNEIKKEYKNEFKEAK